MPSKLGPSWLCRQISERALFVLRGLVAKHSNVRAKIGLPDNLMAAANFHAALHRSWRPEACSAPRTGERPSTAAHQAHYLVGVQVARAGVVALNAVTVQQFKDATPSGSL